MELVEGFTELGNALVLGVGGKILLDAIFLGTRKPGILIQLTGTWDVCSSSMGEPCVIAERIMIEFQKYKESIRAHDRESQEIKVYSHFDSSSPI